jgi:Asp-tRNA(Asn)/Glu-tRNA(Gln) amidotransferase C subunit
MVQQIRRIDAQFGLKLSEEEIHRIAREAEAMEKVLQALYQVDLTQTRPAMGMIKRSLNRRQKRGRQ